MAQIAIEGGKPEIKEFIPYGRQNISEEDIAYVSEALRHPVITRGPKVSAFESEVAKLVGAKYAVAFNSATSALHGAMALYDVKDKNVVTTANTFSATANSVLYCGGKVHFCDTDAKTMNIDVKKLESFENIHLVAAVDYSGNPCDYDSLRSPQKKKKFILIDDASHSLGARYHGDLIGTQTDLTIFSFHPVKPITSGEGGMIVTNNKDEAEYLRIFRNHGIKKTDGPGIQEQVMLGYNYHLTDIQAALGLSQLRKLSQFTKARQEIASQYLELLAQQDLIDLPSLTKNSESSWHLFAIRLKLEKLKVDRSTFLKALHAENIGAQIHYIPVYFHPYYQKLGFKKGLCPIWEHDFSREISLPIFPGLKEDEISAICSALDKLLDFYQK